MAKAKSTTLYGANEGEIGEARGKYGEYTSTNKFETQDAKAWQDFLRTLDETKRTLETSFINRLTILTPDVEKLVGAFKNLAVKIVDSDAFSEAIKFLDDGIKQFGEWISTPQFQKDVLDLVKGVGDVARGLSELVAGLSKVAHFFGIGTDGTGTTPGSKSSDSNAPGTGPGSKSSDSNAPGSDSKTDSGQGGFTWDPQKGLIKNDGTGSGMPSGNAPKGSKEENQRAMELMNGLIARGWSEEAAAAAAGNAQNESHFNTNWNGGGDSGTAHSLMQWRNERVGIIKGYLAKHSELKGMDAYAGAIDYEVGLRKQNYLKTHGLDDKDTFGHAYEVYGDTASQGRRVQSGRNFLQMHRNTPQPKPQPDAGNKPQSSNTHHPRGNSEATNVTVTRTVGSNPTNIINSVANQG